MSKLFVGEAQALPVRCYLLEEDEGAYGVQVELNGEEASARALSPSRQRVLELAEALVRGAVTPVGLRDVVDDWLLE